MNARSPRMTREVVTEGWRLSLDLSPQVLSLDVEQRRREEPQSLSPVVPSDVEGVVSASMLLAKAKQFDDGLYAA